MATPSDPPLGDFPFYRFPPFPQPPPGAKIPVWSEFKSRGIQIILDPESGEIERDGRGVPTAKLGSSHSLTNGERKKNKSKKMRQTSVLPNGQQVRLKWYEEWEELESTRRVNINPSCNRIDRLHEAAAAFKAGRPWPPPLPDYNPLLIWDYWRLHLGIISQIQTEAKKDKTRFNPAEAADDSGDDDQPADIGEQTTPVAVVVDPEERKKLEEDRRAPQESEQKTPDEEAMARREHFHQLREVKKDSFLDDPEFCVKIFFSSHWRDKGYIHDEKKCLEGPILVGFFLRYLLRSRVFPEEEAALKRAIALCDLAKKELPATWTLGRALPDKLNKGFEYLNTMMTTGMYGRGLLLDPYSDGEDDDSDDDDDKAANERDAKKRKLEELCADEPTVQVIDPDNMDLDAAVYADALADNVDVNGAEIKPSVWGAPEPSEPVDASGDGGWGNTWDGGWGSSAAGDTSGWTYVMKNELFAHLGPTALPFTHTTGIVERSTRKITKVIRPPTDARSAQDVSQPEAIEQELERRLGQVILTPWVKIGNHVASDIVPPDVLPDSRGAVVIPLLSKSDLMNHGIRNGGRRSLEDPPDAANTTGPYPPFDPRTDEIRLLVDPQVLDLFEQSLGMGVCATWVQVARKETPGDDVRPEVDLSTKKGRKAPPPRGAAGKNGEPTKFWYMEQVSFVCTSFHTDRYYANQE